MFRLRMAGVLAASALLAAACGDDGGEAVTGDDPQGETEAPTTAVSGSSGSSEADGTEAGDTMASDAVTSTTAAAESDGPDDGAAVDAETLLASATTALEGRSVRGEATVELAPGFEFSTSFESDAEGDLAATVELPPGMDLEFPGGAAAETRYVGGVVYVRPPVPAGTLAELGIDEAWYVAEPAPGGDPTAEAMGAAGGVMCVFPEGVDGAYDDCDPLGETGAFLEAASEAEVTGREDVRGVGTTRVRFTVSLLDSVGEALGMAPDDGETSEDGAFDDTASDPFADGLDQFLGFLDSGLEAEVWIDDENLVRRLAFDPASIFAGLVDGDAGAAVPSSPVTLEFYDFDADISVDAPPPEVIVDSSLILSDDYATSEEFEPA